MIYKLAIETLQSKNVAVAAFKNAAHPQAAQEIEVAQAFFFLPLKGMPKIHCISRVKNQSFIISKYCNRGALSSYLDKTALPLSERIDLAIKAFTAVNQMHEQGFIHHDISLGNFLVHKSKKGEIQVYINDFGFLSRIDSESERPSVINIS